MSLMNEFLNDERGAAMAEYALLLALIAVATIASISTLRDGVIGVFTRASDSMATAAE